MSQTDAFINKQVYHMLNRSKQATRFLSQIPLKQKKVLKSGILQPSCKTIKLAGV